MFFLFVFLSKKLAHPNLFPIPSSSVLFIDRFSIDFSMYPNELIRLLSESSKIDVFSLFAFDNILFGNKTPNKHCIFEELMDELEIDLEIGGELSLL